MLRIFRISNIIQKAPPTKRKLLMEAVFFLEIAYWVIRLFHFHWLTPWFSRRLTAEELNDTNRDALCNDVRWAINRMARLISGGSICFPRAIAAQLMLRRRRVGTEMYYGAAVLPEKGLMAHVWLQDGKTGIVGCRIASQYRVLACYSTSCPTLRS
jgi:hypothetical protein